MGLLLLVAVVAFRKYKKIKRNEHKMLMVTSAVALNQNSIALILI